MQKKFNEKNEIDTYLKRALLRPVAGTPSDNALRVKKHWENASSLQEFRLMIVQDEELKYNRGYGIISKIMKGSHFSRLRKMMEPFMIQKIPTKKGFLKLDLNGHPIYMSNGTNMQGYTITRLCFAEINDLVNMNMFRGYIVVKGNLCVSVQDKTLIQRTGKFQILYGYSFILVKEIKENEFIYAEELDKHSPLKNQLIMIEEK